MEINGCQGKVCSRCKLWKPRTDFHKQSAQKDGLRSECKICHISDEKKRHASNPEPGRRRANQYYADNPDLVRARVRAYRINNPDKIAIDAARSREQRHESSKERSRIYKATLKASRVEPIYREDIISRDGFICYLCELPVVREDLEIDHLLPLARGGQHRYENLVVTHKHCNRSKGKKTYDEYMEYLEKINLELLDRSLTRSR